MNADPFVVAVHSSGKHEFSKATRDSITLLEGLGVEGDAHFGATVQHRWDMKRDPTRPNLRQVHLIQTELLDEVGAKGFHVLPGDMGENISTRGLDLLGLPTGTRLLIGSDVVVEVTGLRNPCVHIETFRKGLLAQVGERGPDGGYIPKAGVMGVVVCGGTVRPNDRIDVRLPEGERMPLMPV
jgi:MOSC domain-containing protein YiiM